MSRDARREQILDAVLPDVLEHGMTITSKRLAAAAGVSEGLVFKVFGDKEALLRAVIARSDERPDPIAAWLATGAHEQLTLDELVAELAGRIADKYAIGFRLFAALAPLMTTPKPDDVQRFEDELGPVARALAVHADELAIPPDAAASLLRTVSIATASAGMWGQGTWGVEMSPIDVARVVLYGVRGPRHARTHETQES